VTKAAAAVPKAENDDMATQPMHSVLEAISGSRAQVNEDASSFPSENSVVVAVSAAAAAPFLRAGAADDTVQIHSMEP
jgi:hypothetical protein